VLLALILWAAPAVAQDDQYEEWVAMPPAQAASLKAKADEYPALLATVEAQKAQLAAQQRLIELQDRLMALKDAEIAAHQRLAGLETQRADAIEGRACTEVRKARVAGYAATGAAIGTAAMPGPGTLVGLAIGALSGFLVPCP
jgi:hypothetical protein